MNQNINLTLQIWLTWIFTKAIGICGAGLAAIGITTSNNSPELMAGVVMTALHLALSWWNTQRALKAAPPAPQVVTTWPLRAAVAATGITALSCALCACSHATSATGAAAAPMPAATSSTTATMIEAALPFVRTGASVATGAVLDFGVKQDSTRTRLASEMYSAANAVYSLSGGTFPTVAQFQSTITAFGGSQTDASYAQFTTAISGLYAAYYPGLAGTDARTAIDLFMAIAGGIEDATQAYVTTPATVATATHA